MTMMAFGTFLYAVGFAMYGFFSSYALFAAAMLVITVGEMVVMPTAQALVAKLAPEDMRGRYMAVFGLTWLIPQATAPLLAGLVMDNADPRWVWFGSGLLGLVGAMAFLLLRRRAERSIEETTAAAEAVVPA
jgi:MFS family permease